LEQPATVNSAMTATLAKVMRIFVPPRSVENIEPPHWVALQGWGNQSAYGLYRRMLPECFLGGEWRILAEH
jgi:hypothetical protein